MNDFLQLGMGIYTIPEASLILNLPVNKLRRWITGYRRISNGKSEHKEIIPDIRKSGKSSGVNLNFLALIELYIIGQLREKNHSFHKIRTARQELVERLNTEYPFANRNILSDGKSILYDLGSEKTKSAIELGTKGQTVFLDIVQDFYERIDFGGSDALAERFWPLGKKSQIVVDPHHCFGAPAIKNTNIPAGTVYDLYLGGERVRTISSLYEIDVSAVEDAIRFMERRVA